MDSLQILTIETRPYTDQKPGTSGLRKKIRVFHQPHYLENFIQSIFDSVSQIRGQTLVLGGDGRYFNDEALQIVIKMAAANGVAGILVGRDGILSTPAVSCLIRKYRACGGIILTASHNPGGPDADFGIKYNIASGGSAPEAVTDAVFRRSLEISHYRTLAAADVDLSRISTCQLATMSVQVIDPVTDYAELLERLFDFDRLHDLLRDKRFRLCYDAMHGATGLYAHTILEQRLGAPSGTVQRVECKPDFGGEAPDPSPLLLSARYDGVFDLIAASDGDGDRHLVMNTRQFVNSSHSIAIMAAHAEHIPGYAGGLNGVARTMPASRALDRVAESLQIPCFETPAGWKFFGSLLDSGDVTLCGDESFGASSSHLREKDGLWAILFWLNILALRRQSLSDIVQTHWQRFGRDLYTRHDYENLEIDQAESLMEDLRRRLHDLPGRQMAGYQIGWSDEFCYIDPLDGSHSKAQGIRIGFANGARIVYRLSGTGTQGATLRLYLERHEPDRARQLNDPQQALAELIHIANDLLPVQQKTLRKQPDKII